MFETGRTALAALASNPDNALVMSNLARTVVNIAQRVAGLRHDLLGRIFHRVLDTARYDGSYYTSTAAAALLAALAIREQDADWSDAEAISQLRICDPACGTGTLLMAAAERIRDLRHAAGQSDLEDDETWDLALVEDVLWGYDSNLTATHLAAATLGMLSPSTQFSRINIHRVRLGVVDGVPYVGSLEFLGGQARLAGWPRLAERIEGDTDALLPEQMDMVIMNPPFTRDSLRYDQFSIREERAVKDRETELVKALPHREAARQHSAGGAFVALGEKMLQQDSGVLALVLPSVVPTAPGNLGLRQFLGQEFHVDTIVTSHDPERIYFSENTSIGEVLMICRRQSRREGKPSTRVVNLSRNPATPVEALDTAARIEREGDDDRAARDFTVQRIEAERVERGDWSATNFLSPFLTGAYRALAEGGMFQVPTTKLRSLADVGPAGQRIRDAYTYQHMPTDQGRRALWFHKTDVTQSMAAEPDRYIVPKQGKEGMADGYWGKRSEMLLPHKLWLPLARVAAVMLPEKVVGSLWTPCRPYRPETAKALCLYLNSTAGLLALLGDRDNRKPSYPSFSLETLRTIPVPDFRELDKDVWDYMAGWFDWLKGETLLPFPMVVEDRVRDQIDETIIQALELDAEWVATVRRELAREPSVMGRRSTLD